MKNSRYSESRRAMQRLLFVAILGTTLVSSHAPAQTSQGSNFDHFTTGFRLDGAHQYVNCESCHTEGMFVGTPTRCEGCHTNASRIRATVKPPVHPLTTDHCDACHRTFSWVPIERMDHLETFGTCFSCHNGSEAMGKPVNHIPATDMCEDCHREITWSPVLRVDHLQVLGTCSSCHNGVIARGQHAQHIPTTLECDSCHNTVSWSP